MPRRNIRLVFLALSLIAFTFIWSCSQPDDVLSGVSRTEVSLSAQRLPSLPAGMAYELWVADDNDTVSLGKFEYNSDESQFLDLDGSQRSSTFTLQGDIFNYTSIFISVETNPDNNTASPGPVMLVDAVTDPQENAINMIFPDKDTLYEAIVRFNMEAVSDQNRNTNDGHGIWFTSYQNGNKYYPDTVGATISIDSTKLRTFTIECQVETVSVFPLVIDTISCDTLDKDQIYEPQEWDVDSTWLETTDVVYGPDTLLLGPVRHHIGFRYHIDTAIDSIPPYTLRTIKFESFDTIPHTDWLDIFTQDEFGLPDYTAWGWKYKGWVVSPYIDTTVVTARLTPPAWPYNTANNVYIPGAEGALVTTGTFTDVTGPDDDGAGFGVSDQWPQYPGQDFLDSAALMTSLGVSSVNFMPFSSGNVGTVFITLEPDNFNSNTNFPLFVFIRAVPDSRSTITASQVSVTMTPWTQSSDLDLRGFPKVIVSKIQRY